MTTTATASIMKRPMALFEGTGSGDRPYEGHLTDGAPSSTAQPGAAICRWRDPELVEATTADASAGKIKLHPQRLATAQAQAAQANSVLVFILPRHTQHQGSDFGRGPRPVHRSQKTKADAKEMISPRSQKRPKSAAGADSPVRLNRRRF